MSQSEPITVCVTRTVKAGCEAEFERALHEFVQRTIPAPGQHGVHIMRPAPGSHSRDYGIIRQFDNREALEDFRTSEEYLEWNALAADLTEGRGNTRELTGLESWFTLPGASLRPLPKWKMAVATFLGVFPVVTLLNLTLGPLIPPWHFVIKSAVFNACVVAMLTWAVMPLITRALHPWLHSEQPNT